MKNKVSIIIPCYNEKSTILNILKKIEDVYLNQIEKEIIIVDDFSTDGTRAILKSLKKYKVIFNEKNHGKGFSVRKGIKNASGDIIIIQDADLEYDPGDYKNLLQPILENKAQVVYGSRERNKNNKIQTGLFFYLGGLFLTKLTNILYGSKLTDQSTCYKIFLKYILDDIDLQENRFGFCSEITAKLLLKNIKPYEVPINYFPRKKFEGKKISWKDGIRAIYVLLKYRIIGFLK